MIIRLLAWTLIAFCQHTYRMKNVANKGFSTQNVSLCKKHNVRHFLHLLDDVNAKMDFSGQFVTAVNPRSMQKLAA